MLNNEENKWRKYGGWIFIIPIALQLIWDVVSEQYFSFQFFVEVYLFGGFMAIVALFCAGKIK